MAPKNITNGERVTITEFILRIFDERDRQYDLRFKAAETAVSAALTANKELTNQALTSGKEAVIKAEEAQKSYNASHNDLARKMDAQTQDMLPRPEAMALLKAMSDRSDAAIASLDDKIMALRKEADVRAESARSEIVSLQLSRGTGEGRGTGVKEGWGWAAGIVGLVIGVLGLVSGIIGILSKLKP